MMKFACLAISVLLEESRNFGLSEIFGQNTSKSKFLPERCEEKIGLKRDVTPLDRQGKRILKWRKIEKYVLKTENGSSGSRPAKESKVQK